MLVGQNHQGLNWDPALISFPENLAKIVRRKEIAGIIFQSSYLAR
jgi:hypothetical protein